MIPSFEDPGFFNGKLIAGAFNDADDPIGPVFIPANGTWILVGKIKTDGAEFYLFLYL